MRYVAYRVADTLPHSSPGCGFDRGVRAPCDSCGQTVWVQERNAAQCETIICWQCAGETPTHVVRKRGGAVRG